MSPSTAISFLRQNLQDQGLSLNEIDAIVDSAAMEIDGVVLELLSNAVNEAANSGVEMGIDDFISEITVSASGGSYSVGTISGQEDFSNPPFPLLPHLLKNAKTAKDGHLYKVIPVGDKTPSPRPRSSMDAARQVHDQMEQAKQAAKSTSVDKHSSPQPTRATDFFASNLSIKWPSTREIRANKPRTTSATTFRTATSKQDPSSQWVLPAKPANMTGILSEINTRLQADIYSAVDQIIKKYGG